MVSSVWRHWQQPGEEYKDKCVLPTVKRWWECHGLGLHECCRHWELQFIEGTMNANMYCDILKQRLCSRAVFQHDNDPFLAKAAEGKGDGLAKHVSRPKLYWASVEHPQTEGGGAQGL